MATLQGKRHFVFYANASAQIGSGHIMRLLAIAQVCIRQSITVTFACTQCPESLQQRLMSEGFLFILLPQHFTHEDIRKHEPAAIFVDDYDISQRQWQVFKNTKALLINLDDNLDKSKLISHVIINPAADANEPDYKLRAPEAKFCLGPEFTFLRQEFAEQAFVCIDQRDQLLITLGGADVKNMTYWLAKEIIQTLPNVNVCILLGALNTSALPLLNSLCERHSKLKLIHQSEQVAAVMMQSGLAVSAAGGTLGELASMGVPTLALVSSNNQMPALESPLINTWYTALDARDFEAPIVNDNLALQSQALVDDIVLQVHELWRDLCKRQRMSAYARQIIDSHGCDRIVQTVQEQLTAVNADT